jgi:hypothetical protein
MEPVMAGGFGGGVAVAAGQVLHEGTARGEDPSSSSTSR